MIRRYALTTLVSLIGNVMAGAQTFSNSPFSIYGTGTLQPHLSSLNRGMSGTGIAVQDPFNLNHTNPASYINIRQPISHIFELGIYASSSRLSTASSTESKSSGGLTHLNYWFKFNPRWAATIGLTPYSSMSYDIMTQRELGGSSVEYNHHGSGNVNALKMGNAFQVAKNFSLGFNASFLFGSLNKFETVELPAGSYTLENKFVTRKLTIDAGAQYRLSFNKRALVIGLTAAPGIKLKAQQSSSLYDDDGADTLYTAEGETVHYKLPSSFGLGLALEGSRSIFAADVKHTSWSKAQFAKEDVILTDTWRLSAGYHYKGNPDAMNYIGLVSLRAGAYVQNHQLTIHDNNLKAWGGSLGASFPAFDNRSAVNLVYNFDQLGTTTSGLIRQQSHTLSLEIVIRDLWGIKRKFD